jgi:trk system potassium uptake protein TrkA
MYIIIGGGGQVGYYLAKELLSQPHEVLLLEKEPRRFKQLKEQLGASNVGKGDACEVRVLDEFGCQRADMVIAVTGDDEDNLVICQVAKARFEVKRTVARVNNPRNIDLFQALGIDRTVSPTEMLLHTIESEIPHRKLLPLMELSRAGLHLVELTVPSDSSAAGQMISDLHLPTEANLVLITRSDTPVIPRGDTIIHSDDTIYALVRAQGEGEQALRRAVLGDTA